MRMYERRRFWGRGIALSLVLFAAVILVFVRALGSVSASAHSESKQAAEEAIRRAIVTCYAVEGVYPSEFSYLEEHYGVRVSRDRYAVHYQALGENVMPYVELVEIGTP